MKKELEQQLAVDFPSFFADLGGDPRQTCMAWGCAVGDGWYGILRGLCVNLTRAMEDDPAAKNFKFEQIKEKFGLLRIYYTGGNEEMHNLVDGIEQVSSYVCENCGTTSDVETKGGWLRTLCKNCRRGPGGVTGATLTLDVNAQ